LIFFHGCGREWKKHEEGTTHGFGEGNLVEFLE